MNCPYITFPVRGRAPLDCFPKDLGQGVHSAGRDLEEVPLGRRVWRASPLGGVITAWNVGSIPMGIGITSLICRPRNATFSIMPRRVAPGF